MIVNGIEGVVMQKIFDSKGVLCHMVFSMKACPVEGRTDIAPETEGLQAAFVTQKAGKVFKAHRHLIRERMIPRTQEAWVIMKGKVQLVYFDLKGNEIGKAILNEGDITLTFTGGHEYTILEDCEAFEFKLGPFSPTNDKEYFG